MLIEEGDHALPPLEVGVQRGEHHRVCPRVRLQLSGHLQQRRHTHRSLCPRRPRRHHRRRVVIRMDDNRPRSRPRHRRPHVVRRPLLPIHPPPQPHLYRSATGQPPPQPLPSGPLQPKARHIQRHPRVLALPLLSRSRIRAHKHHRPCAQRRGLQPSVSTRKVQHHHPPSHLLPIEIAPIPIATPNRHGPQPLRRHGRSPRPIRPYRVQVRRLTLPLQPPAPVHRHHHRKGVASRRQPQRLQSPLHIRGRLVAPRIARHPRPQRGQMLHHSSRPGRSRHRADGKGEQKGDIQRDHKGPNSTRSFLCIRDRGRPALDEGKMPSILPWKDSG